MITPELIAWATLAIASVALLISFYLLAKVAKIASNASQQDEQQQIKLANLDAQCEDAKMRVEESHAALMTLHQSVQPLHAKIAELEGKLREQEPFDPQIKLYQKATSMAKSHTSAEEIAASCDLPLAEAQMLVNLYAPK